MRDKLKTAELLVQECFWGDYQLSPEQILKKLDEREPGFDVFLFSKIIENSRYPSKYLRILFTPEDLNSLLDRYLKQNESNRRVRLVMANITGKSDFVPEYRWGR